MTGSSGEAVSDVQKRLKQLGYNISDAEGVFDNGTTACVKQFQQSRGLLVDGIVGDETWQDLVEASYTVGSRALYLKSPYLRGDDIRTVQLWLRTLGFNPGPIDSIYGPDTETAVKEFQFNSGLRKDGIVSTNTIEAFMTLKTALERNEQVELPHYEMPSYSTLSAIENQLIVIDVGHGGPDKGAIGPTSLFESEVCEDIGLRAANLFEMLGTQITFTRKIGQGRTMARRIDHINESNAAFVISIHLNHSQNPKAEGVCCYYFSSGNISSTKGQKIAHSLQHELVSALQAKDCRVHGKKFNILRLTKIPAVIVEPGFITNAAEETLLKDPDYRQKIATAIFDGLQYYLKKES